MPDLLFALVLNADVHVDRVLIRQLCSVLHHFAIIVSRCDAVVGWKRHTYWGATRHIFESERGVPRSAFDLWALMHAGMLVWRAAAHEATRLKAGARHLWHSFGDLRIFINLLHALGTQVALSSTAAFDSAAPA
jgi:hypothetical protein